jgi:hypothetical protein
MVRQQYRQATEAGMSRNMANMPENQQGITPLPMTDSIQDRDQRLKDASALAFDATALRPMTARTGVSTGSSSPLTGSGTPARQRTPNSNRPTSAGRFAQPFSKQAVDRRTVASFEGIEEEAELQTQVSTRRKVTGLADSRAVDPSQVPHRRAGDWQDLVLFAFSASRLRAGCQLL